MKVASSDEAACPSPSSHSNPLDPLEDKMSSFPTSSTSLPYMHLHLQTDNPLRKTPPTTSNSTSTPLLKASLNSPPVVHTMRNGKSTTSGMDLSLTGCKRPSPEDKKPAESQYTNLLLQLRQSSPSPLEPLTSCSPSKKLKSSSSNGACYQCPVCQKVFQRHIALNAHFQNEHIGQSKDDDQKVCRLCLHKSKSMTAVRKHLWEQHRIDLDAPANCLTNDKLRTIKVRTSPEKLSPKEINNNLCIKDESKENKTDSDQATDLSLKPKSDSKPESPPKSSDLQTHPVSSSDPSDQWKCFFCNIVFPNQTLYFLHRGFHSETNPWRCNGCGKGCKDMYDFNTHLLSESHN